MTKINGNGQLEWTFEELDLSGALDDIHIEFNKIDDARNVLIGLMDKATDDDWSNLVAADRLLSKKSKVLLDVMNLIMCLKNARRFN